MTHPILETNRLVLRFPQIGDEPAFTAFMTSERAKHLGGPLTRGRAWRSFAHLVGQWEMRGYGVFVVTDRQTGRPIGGCGPFYPVEMDEPEIGWALWDASLEGKGLMLEAALAVRDHVYQTLGWVTATSNIDDGNTRSIALAERLGCVREKSYTEATEDGDVLVHLYRHPSASALSQVSNLEARA